ncbi:MAG: hypothetical protein K2X95_02845 [Flavobacteriaceae bacterium]|nr:hypothetical protein [Flavobacteriaceae bacterium]
MHKQASATAADQAKIDSFKKAFSVCIEGKGIPPNDKKTRFNHCFVEIDAFMKRLSLG